MRPPGVVDAGVADHSEELLQAAWPRGSAVRVRGPAGDDRERRPAPPDRSPEHRSPRSLTDCRTDRQQSRRNRLTHPGVCAALVSSRVLSG